MVKELPSNSSKKKVSKYRFVAASNASNSSLVGCLKLGTSYTNEYAGSVTAIESSFVGEGVNGEGAVGLGAEVGSSGGLSAEKRRKEE